MSASPTQTLTLPAGGVDLPRPSRPAGGDLDPQHPGWCPGGCTERTSFDDWRMLPHIVEAFGLVLTDPVDTDDYEHWAFLDHLRGAQQPHPAAAAVRLLRIDSWSTETGELTLGHGQIVLDLLGIPTSLTRVEAARLGAALLRAAQLLGGGQ